MSQSIIAVVLFALFSQYPSALVVPPVYIGQVDFEKILSTTGETENPSQLDEVVSGIVSDSGVQVGDEPVQVGDDAQETINTFADIPDFGVNFPEFGELVDALAGFGYRKGSMETIPDEDSILTEILAKDFFQ